MGYCIVCKRTWTNKVSFHRFPRDAILRNKWIQAIGKDRVTCDTKWAAVCGDHFDPECLEQRWGRVRLKKDSVPKRNLYSPDEIKKSMDNSEVTDSEPIFILKIPKTKHHSPYVIEVESIECPSHVKEEFIPQSPSEELPPELIPVEELPPKNNKPTVRQISRFFQEHCYEGTAAAVENILYLEKTYNPNDDLSQSPVMDNTMDNTEEECIEIEPVCRICACSSDQLIDVFSKKSQKEEILNKIHTYLPIMVTRNSTLPSNICLSCCENVNKWHSFVTSCLDADTRLKRIYGSEEYVPDNENLDSSRTYSVRDVSKMMMSHYQSNIACDSNITTASSPNVTKDIDADDASDVMSDDASIHSREVDVLDESGESGTKAQAETVFSESEAEDSHIQTINSESEDEQIDINLNSSDPEVVNEVVITDTKTKKKSKDINLNSSVPEVVNEVVITDTKTKKKSKKLLYRCDACKIVFTSCDQLVSHQINVHNIKVFSCSSCKIVFNASEVSFTQHMSVCGKKSSNKSTSLNLQINRSQKLASEDIELLFSQFLSSKNNSDKIQTNQNSSKETNMSQIDHSSNFGLKENASQSSENIKVTKIVVSKDNNIKGASTITMCKNKGMFLPLKEKSLNIKEMEINNSKKLFYCLRCKKKFKTKRHFTLHCLRRHEGVDITRLKPVCYSCDMCDKKFHVMRNLKRHIKLHSINFPCTVCGELCVSKYRLEKHERSHGAPVKKSYLCDLCGKQCMNKETLKCHQESHDDQEYICDICGKSVKNITQHRRSHLAGKIKYTCDICGKSFLGHKPRLREHMNLHTGERAFKCPECPKSFHARTNYNQHMLQHDAIPRFKCDFCEKRFRRKCYRNIHAKTHFREKVITCHICMKSFKNHKDLCDHRTQHTIEEIQKYRMKQKKIYSGTLTRTAVNKKYPCGVCGKEFKYRPSLYLHKKVHEGGKKIKCDVCNKEFLYLASLQLHYQIHTGEKPHQCTQCDASFRFKSSLQRHMYHHTGEKPFKCEICDKSFHMQGLLAQHKTVHFPNRPFECNVCEARFKRRTTLDNHLRIHTGERPYGCKICGRTFKQCSDRNKHVSLHFKKGEVPESFECNNLTVDI